MHCLIEVIERITADAKDLCVSSLLKMVIQHVIIITMFGQTISSLNFYLSARK